MSGSPFQLSLFEKLSRPERPRLSFTRGQVMEKAGALAYRISRELSVPVRLAVTDNRTTMISFRRSERGLLLRLHHMFLHAPDGVVQALADYAGRGHSRAGKLLDAFILEQQPLIRRERDRRDAELNPRGRCFDLRAVYETINRDHFGGAIQARIGWGRFPAKRRRKSIRLGVYEHQTREIRIHPALDRPQVPAYFLEFIVFHEMLHQLFPSSSGAGRRVHHSADFRERERSFPHYDAALRWERENLHRLLGS